MAQDAALSGVLVVGRYLGVQGGRFPFLNVETEYVKDGQLCKAQRRVGYQGYDSGTGVQTEVGLAVEALQPGDRIAINVFTDVREFTRDGKTSSFVTFDATGVQKLG